MEYGSDSHNRSTLKLRLAEVCAMERDNLWRQYFHWSVLLRWEVLGWIIAFLPGIGGILLALDQYGWANACFIGTSIFVFAKVAHVAVTSNDAWWRRMIFTFLLFGLVGVAIVESVRGVNHLAQSKRPVNESRSIGTSLAIRAYA